MRYITPIIIFTCIVLIGLILVEFKHRAEMHEYQIELNFDTVLVYQNSRFVGSYVLKEPISPIDSIFIYDNQ